MEKKRVGKISLVKKEYRNDKFLYMEKSLATHGYYKVPGTYVYKLPYREATGKYRTGLDPDALYIKSISNPTERKIEQERCAEALERLQNTTGLDLGPTSKYWNFSNFDPSRPNETVQPARLIAGDNYFDLSDPFQEIQFSWLRVHPTIAISLEAYKRGDYPLDVQYYVCDDEYENVVVYNRKKQINDAITILNNMSYEKQLKVARLMGLPVSDGVKNEVLYNIIDNAIKNSEAVRKRHTETSAVSIFMMYAKMKEDVLTIRDLIVQCIENKILSVKEQGKIYKGSVLMAKNEDELVEKLSLDEGQEYYISLQEELKAKKMTLV